MTGSILVDDDMRKVKTDISLTEGRDTDRMIRQAERYYIDSNMLLNLSQFVGFVFTQNDLAKATKLPSMRKSIAALKAAIAIAATTSLNNVAAGCCQLIQRDKEQNHQRSARDTGLTPPR